MYSSKGPDPLTVLIHLLYNYVMLESRCLRLLLSEPSFPGNQGAKTLQVLRPPFLLDRSPTSIQSISHSEITCLIHVLSDTL